jgi:hypothetical protein
MTKAKRLFLIFFMFVPLFLFAKKIELIVDWPVSEKEGLGGSISQALSAKGDTLVVTDFSIYRQFLHKDSKEKFKLNPEIKKVVFWNLPQKFKKIKIERLPQQKLILFMWEPPTVQKKLYKKQIQKHFAKIYTWDDDLVDNVRFFKFYYPVLRPVVSNVPAFEDKKLCTMIFSYKHSRHPQQLYTAREEMIQFFEKKDDKDFEFYGWGWEKTGYRSYRGAVPDKLAVLKNYRFCVCYENIQGKRGYVTEKIFDAFAGGCVPIYWGASNIEEYVPADCFIDRRKFKSNEELYAFLKQMTKNEYEGYLKRITKWLGSEEAKRFSVDNFVKIFAGAI